MPKMRTTVPRQPLADFKLAMGATAVVGYMGIDSALSLLSRPEQISSVTNVVVLLVAVLCGLVFAAMTRPRPAYGVPTSSFIQQIWPLLPHETIAKALVLAVLAGNLNLGDYWQAVGVLAGAWFLGTDVFKYAQPRLK